MTLTGDFSGTAHGKPGLVLEGDLAILECTSAIVASLVALRDTCDQRMNT